MKTDYTFTQVVNIPVEKAYKLAAEVEKYPQFISNVKSVQVLSEDDHSKTVEIIFHHPLLSVRHVGYATFEPNRRIEIQQIEGLVKNMSIIWEFKPLNSKTRVTLRMFFETNSRFFGILTKRGVEKITKEILQDFIREAGKI